MIATWEVLKQPSHLMYRRVTSFLLVKPVLELTILPDFIALFNASDGNRLVEYELQFISRMIQYFFTYLIN